MYKTRQYFPKPYNYLGGDVNVKKRFMQHKEI